MRFNPLHLFFLMILAGSLSADEKAIISALKSAETSEQKESLIAQRKNEITPAVCDALVSEGNQLLLESDFTNAMKVYDLAKYIADRIGDRAAFAKSIRGIGLIDLAQGRKDAGYQKFQESLRIAKEIGDKDLMSAVLRNIGSYYYGQGNDEAALVSFRESIAIAEEIGNKEQIAAALNNIGNVYMFNGNYAQALQHLTRALTLQKNKRITASILTNTAVVYDLQGNYLQALDYYRKSLALWEELGNKSQIANVLNNMGDYRLLGSYDLALEQNKKALAIAQEIGDPEVIGRALANIGNAYAKKGDHDQGLEYIQKSLKIAQEINDLHLASSQLKQLGREYYSKGDYVRALQYSQSAIATSKRVNNRQALWESLTINGKAYRSLNKPEKAHEAFQEAIATIEDWRSLIAGGEVEQLNLFAEKASVYHEMIDLLISENRTAEAFVFAERAKARVLNDVLHSGKIQIAKAMTAQEIEEEKKWSKQLVNLNDRIQKETQAETLKQLQAELQKARLDFESFRTNLYVSHPELKVKRGETLALKPEETNGIIDADTAILEFVVTEKMVYLFVLSKQPADATTKFYPIEISQTQLAELIPEFRSQIAERLPIFQKAATELYTILLSPAASEIRSKKKLLIIPDGVLWELPFQVLKSEEGRYVLEDHALTYAPSVTVYREMKRMNKPMENEASVLLAFGNPTIGKNVSERLKYNYREESLDPLPEAEREVQSLEKLYGAGKSRVYIREKALEETLKNEASNFRIFHFATHGILNDVTPLYSQVVLSHTDSNSNNEDGLLEAWEIMNLDLKADLVVLSACNTALGRISNGEGMIGLTWAFFIAGSSTTVVSQWKVLSSSTTELMLEFHRNLMADPATSKAEAMRAAAMKLMRSDEYKHPFYWAPFVVIGSGF
jgi:CHAT domain-containing protein